MYTMELFRSIFMTRYFHCVFIELIINEKNKRIWMKCTMEVKMYQSTLMM